MLLFVVVLVFGRCWVQYVVIVVVVDVVALLLL